MNATNAGMSNPRKFDEWFKRSLRLFERALEAKPVGREYQWSISVTDALDQVRRSLQSRPIEPAESEAVDTTRPTLARQAADLQREYSECLQRADAMYTEVKKVSRKFAPRDRARIRSEAGKDEAIPDFRDIRRRGTDLLHCLHHVRDEEANLVLESVNTDIGVGD